MTDLHKYSSTSVTHDFYEKNGDSSFYSYYTQETQDGHNHTEYLPAQSSPVDHYAGSEQDALPHHSYDSGVFFYAVSDFLR